MIGAPRRLGTPNAQNSLEVTAARLGSRIHTPDKNSNSSYQNLSGMIDNSDPYVPATPPKLKSPEKLNSDLVVKTATPISSPDKKVETAAVEKVATPISSPDKKVETAAVEKVVTPISSPDKKVELH